MDNLKVFIPLFLLIVTIVGCGGEKGGRLFDSNLSKTGDCEGNISVSNTVNLLKDHNLTYNNESFYFGFDGINDYETGSSYKDGGSYDLNIHSNDADEIKEFLFYINDDGDAILSGDLNGTIDLYCVSESTWIKYISSVTQKSPLKAVENK